jgi:hypothetical protein
MAVRPCAVGEMPSFDATDVAIQAAAPLASGSFFGLRQFAHQEFLVWQRSLA